jgi:hypothetical protein
MRGEGEIFGKLSWEGESRPGAGLSRARAGRGRRPCLRIRGIVRKGDGRAGRPLARRREPWDAPRGSRADTWPGMAGGAAAREAVGGGVRRNRSRTGTSSSIIWMDGPSARGRVQRPSRRRRPAPRRHPGRTSRDRSPGARGAPGTARHAGGAHRRKGSAGRRRQDGRRIRTWGGLSETCAPAGTEGPFTGSPIGADGFSRTGGCPRTVGGSPPAREGWPTTGRGETDAAKSSDGREIRAVLRRDRDAWLRIGGREFRRDGSGRFSGAESRKTHEKIQICRPTDKFKQITSISQIHHLSMSNLKSDPERALCALR